MRNKKLVERWRLGFGITLGLTALSLASGCDRAESLQPRSAEAQAQTRTASGPADPAGDPSRPAPPGYVAVPGTRVSLKPPGGFEVDPVLPGFRHAASGTSIMVIESHAGFAGAARRYTDDRLKERGMTLQRQEQVRFDGHPGLLVKTAELVDGRVFEKWIGVFGDGKLAVLSYAAYPQEASDRFMQPLEQAVRSAHWDRSGEVNPFAGLRFTIGDVPGLDAPRRLGKLVTLRPTQVSRDAPAGGPVVTISHGVAQEQIGDLRRFAQGRAYQIRTLTQIEFDKSQVVEIDGLEGYALEADARSVARDHPMRLYQVVLFDGPSYYLIQGLTTVEYAPKHLPLYRQLARTLTRR